MTLAKRMHGVGSFLPDSKCNFANDDKTSHPRSNILRCEYDVSDPTLHMCNKTKTDSYWYRYGNTWHCVQNKPENIQYKCAFNPNESHPWCNESFGTGFRKQPDCCRRRTTLDDLAVCSSLCRTLSSDGVTCADGDTLNFTGHSQISDGDQTVLCTRNSNHACMGKTKQTDDCL